MDSKIIFELLRSDGSLIINKSLVFAIGLNEATIYCELLSRYNYFAEREELQQDGSFFNTINDLYLGTGLGERAQRTAIKNLVKFNLISMYRRGVPQRRYFKINNNSDLILKYLEHGKQIMQNKKAELIKKQRSNAYNHSIPANAVFNSCAWGVLKPALVGSNNTNSNNTKLNNTNINNNGSFTNELVSFSTYLNNLSKEEYTEYLQSINSIEYFIHVRDQKGFKECQYKTSTWEDIINNWLNVSDVDEKLTVDQSYDLIDKFFETKFKDCDYSPAFYCSGKIKANRYYELRRNKGED